MVMFLIFYWVFSTIVSFVAFTEQSRKENSNMLLLDAFVNFVGSVVYGWLFVPIIVGKILSKYI